MHGFSIVLAGCRVRGGTVHGATASDVDYNSDDPSQNVSDLVNIADVHATMLATLGLDPKLQAETPVGRPMLLSEGAPADKVLLDS